MPEILLSKLNYSMVIFFSFLCFTSCMPMQAYFHIVPDEKDVNRFKYETVKLAGDCHEFNTSASNKSLYVTNWTAKEPLIRLPLNDFLKNQQAKYFLVIKNDSILYQYTDKKIKSYNPVPSFSISKSFVSACLGIALKEGLIHSVDDLVKDYLPELNYHENFNTLTINHLLNQKSGLKMKVPNVADAYYGKVEKVLHRLTFIAKPGDHFEYININYTLLGLIIERQTKQDLHIYFSDRIWSRIGTCDSSIWGYDYKTHHTRAIGAFAGSARDYAKFGILYMNHGKWSGQQLIDSNWVNTSINPVNALGENVGYNNSWFIGEKEIGDYMAIGMYRQQIYINPKHNVVIVSLMKFNKDNLDLRWWEILRQITEQVE